MVGKQVMAGVLIAMGCGIGVPILLFFLIVFSLPDKYDKAENKRWRKERKAMRHA